MTLKASIHPACRRTRLLVTHHGDDCLKASLPGIPRHPRALHTLLEGIALWYSQPLTAAIIVGDNWDASLVDDLFGGGLWPHDLAYVRFDIHRTRRPRRIRGLGDFRDIYAAHGRNS